MKRLLLTTSSLFILFGCSTRTEDKFVTGTDARTQIQSQKGTTEDINTYESGSYWSESWWYWTKGIEYTFGKSERTEENIEKGFLNLSTKKILNHQMSIIKLSMDYEGIEFR